jgi:uncharacterized protein (TIGR02444 family)
MVEPADETAAAAEAFWAFSLDFYARPGVAATCLALQDGRGLDVNIVLLCCWHGWSGRGQLSPADLDRVETAVAGWRGAVVEGLRSVRRALKGVRVTTAPTLRAEVQRLELAAEREAQQLIVAALLSGPAAPGDPGGNAAASLASYLAAHQCDPSLALPLVAALRAAPADGA